MSEADNIKTLWQCQTVETNVASVQALRNRGNKLRRIVQCGNAAVYIVSTTMIAWYGYDLWHNPKGLLETFIYVYLAGTMVWMMSVLRLLNRVTPTPTSETLDTHLDFLVLEYERQIALEKKAISWFLVPVLIGAVAQLVSALMLKPMGLRSLAAAAVIVLIMVGLYGLGTRAIRARVRRLQGSIDSMKAIRNNLQNGTHVDVAHNHV
jgi:hypothetical protein